MSPRPQALPFFLVGKLALWLTVVSGVVMTLSNLGGWSLGLNVSAWTHVAAAVPMLLLGGAWWWQHWKVHGRSSTGSRRTSGLWQSGFWAFSFITGVVFFPVMGNQDGMWVVRILHGAVVVAAVVMLVRHLSAKRAR